RMTLNRRRIGLIVWSRSSLPVQTKCKLDLPRTSQHCRNGTRRRRADAPGRQAEIRTVQNVEEFRTKLQTDFLAQAKILIRTQIPSEKARADQDVASSVAKRVQRRVHETACVKPLVDGLLVCRKVAIAHAIGTGERACICGRIRKRNRERRARLRGHDAGHLPSANESIREAISIAQISPSMPER